MARHVPTEGDVNYPQRKAIRLRGYDYSQGGVYFCTVCVHKMHRHKALFGHIDQGEMQLNRFGRLVEKCWLEGPSHRENLILDEFQIMPNHFHAILRFEAPIQIQKFSAAFGSLGEGSLSSALGGFKSDVTREIGRLRTEKTVVWQPRFHHHIVRSEPELLAIRQYIQNNLAQWENDRCHPQHPDFERTWQGHSPNPPDFLP